MSAEDFQLYLTVAMVLENKVVCINRFRNILLQVST